MNRWILGIAATIGVVCGTQTASAQIVYVPGSVYSAPVYSTPVYVGSPVVSAYYAAPAYSTPVYSSPVVQMAYSVPTISAPVIASPVIVSPNVVRQTTRGNFHNYTQTTRVYGPTPGPHYSRVHVHSGLFGTTVRERVR